MRTPRAERRLAALLALLVAGSTAVVVATSGNIAGGTRIAEPGASAWRGLVGSRPAVALGSRVIVVLRTPSLAQRVTQNGDRASARQERAWSDAGKTAQRLLISRLALQGVSVRRDYTFTRVLDGFSTLLDPSAFPVVEADKDVAGIYPARVAYPASISTHVLSRRGYGRPNVGVSGLDGRGVTIALLDTGVDPTVPYLHGRVLHGIDIVNGDASRRERHGTEMAGLLVGKGGPAGLSGVAPGASVLPIRVAGRQPDGLGRWAIYARGDQIVAGLERAVDPNDDGDAHDAARIALLALAEPFAGFDDSPEAQAVAGATALDTLVVAPSGNDGTGASGYGDIAGPGGAPDALTVGAVDTRVRVDTMRILVRSGLQTILDRSIAIAGAARPTGRLDLQIARTGAALVRGGASPALAVERAASAGASAVLLYGLRTPLPAGGLGLDDSAQIPVVSVSNAVARAVLKRLAAGDVATVTLGNVESVANVARGTVASFSSTGLSYDGRVKPELVAPGVGLATSDRGAKRFVTVNGSSAAAAIVAGAAALVAQARPMLGADALKGVLVGAGNALDARGAIASELVASPSTLALHRARAGFTLRNLSPHAVKVTLRAVTHDLQLRPSHVFLREGENALVQVSAATATPTDGAVVARVAGGGDIRIPWAISFPSHSVDLIGSAALSDKVFAASDEAPTLLSVDAGRVLVLSGRVEIRPVRRLDIALSHADGRPIGLLVRVRDLLPGRYAFGITGRGPNGQTLSAGAYLLTLRAYPVDGGPPSVRRLRFSLR